MLVSFFKISLNLLCQQTVTDTQMITRGREEEDSISLKVKKSDVSEHFGFNMITL